MSQELLYHVRLKLKDGDVEAIEKDLNRLEKQKGTAPKTKATKEVKEATKQLKEQESVLKALRKELNEYKETLAQVQLQAREMGGATELNVQEQRELGQAIADTKSKLESASRGNLDYNSALNDSGSSIREMKMSLRALKLAIDEVKDPLGEGAEKVAELTQQHDELNTSIGSVEKSMGVHTRNVGNYEGSLRALSNSIAIVQGPLGPLAGRINSAATAISRWRETNIAGASSAITLGRAIRVGLIASGIGLLIIAFTSLLAFFRRTEKGQQAVRVGAAALSAVFETFADIAVSLGEALHNAFQNPKQAITDLGEAIKQNLINRWKAIPEFIMAGVGVISKGFQALAVGVRAIWDKDAREDAKRLFREAGDELVKFGDASLKIITGIDDPIKKITSGVVSLAKEINKNVKENIRNANEMNDILVRERDLLVERARMERNTAQAREDSRDLTIEAEKRLEGLLKVRAQEEEMLKRELQLERDRLRVMTEQNDRFSSREEQLRELAEQQAKIFQMETTHAKTMMSLTRDQVSVERQIRDRETRLARIAFEERMGWKELEIEAEARKLENMGRMVQAELLRQEETEVEAEIRKNLRLAVLKAEFEAQMFNAKQASIMAQNAWELEEAQRKQKAEMRLDDLLVQAKVQKLQLIGKMISSFNSAFFNDNKALAAASAIVDTYSGIVAALGARPWGPWNFANAAVVGAQGIANVRKIISTQLGSSSVDSSASSVQAPSTSFGFVDLPSVGAEVASQQPMPQNMQPNIILEGEFDPEFLSVKVRQGNNTISGNTLGIGI